MSKEVVRAHVSHDQWIKEANAKERSLDGYVQILSDKTVSKLKCTVCVAYPVHANFLNKSVRREHWLIDGGHILVRFLTVYNTGERMDGEESREYEDTYIERHVKGSEQGWWK